MDQDVDASFLLAGGMVFDGSGGASYAGDVPVVGNRIEAVLKEGERRDVSGDRDWGHTGADANATLIELVMKDGQIYRDERSD